MARTVVLGNGRLLVAMDPRGVVRELCWPMPGYRNHLLGKWIRLGVHIDGTFTWLDSPEWACHQAYEGPRLAATTFESAQFQIRVTLRDWVEPGRDVWHRKVTVENGAETGREIRLFQTQMPFLNEQNVGLCGAWLPDRQGILHYKDQTYILFQALPMPGQSVNHSIGVTGVGGFEGTWRDAEDGSLEEKPVSVGSVDSTLSVSGSADPGEAVEFRLAVSAGSSEAGLPVPAQVPPPQARHPIGTAERAVAVILAHIGPEGQLIAGCDSSVMGENTEHYSYVWPRDCSLTLAALEENGTDLVPACLGWLSELPRIQGHFHQRYLPNGSPASTWHPRTCEFPFQQDETALVATLASSHSSGLRLAAELAPILKGHRLNGLPKPSWDLWEERYGVHFWTVCTVVEALDSVAAATNDAEAGLIADTMWEALSTSFFSPTGEIARRLTDGVPDWTPDSSVLGGLLHCRRTSGHQLESAVSMVESHLRVNTQVGGVARYVGDYYARVDDTVPGNPWVICTCWLGQAYTRLGRIEEARQILDWVDKVGGPTGLLPEQLHPQTGESMTVQPLPWSHAEALILVNGLRGTRPSG